MTDKTWEDLQCDLCGEWQRVGQKHFCRSRVYDFQQFSIDDLKNLKMYLDGLYYYGFDNQSLRQGVDLELRRHQSNDQNR